MLEDEAQLETPLLESQLLLPMLTLAALALLLPLLLLLLPPPDLTGWSGTRSQGLS